MNRSHLDSWSYDRVMLQLPGAAGTGESQGQKEAIVNKVKLHVLLLGHSCFKYETV